MFNGARILVSPLDWGLGHSTRCVPIIQRLIDRGAEPIIGADAAPLALLRKEFPQLEHVRIPGVDVRYSKSSSQLWSMARQFPAMVRSVQAERALFDRLRQQLCLDAVISDQRFGIRSAELPSVIITHQVFPFTPIAQTALRKVNLHHIARYDRCWIMDEPEAPGLAGELSHVRSIPANARYIGTVSRMHHTPALSQGEGGIPLRKRYRVIAVISGPEPQRTLLEHLLIDQLRSVEGEHLLVLGLPNEIPGQARNDIPGNLTVRSHLSGIELAEAMLASDLIVSRSGYTTLMDLVSLGRTALIIPTPGQAEQEYLGKLHAGTGRFITQRQDSIDIKAALVSARTSKVPVTDNALPLLERALEDLATLLR